MQMIMITLPEKWFGTVAKLSMDATLEYTFCAMRVVVAAFEGWNVCQERLNVRVLVQDRRTSKNISKIIIQSAMYAT